MEAYDQYLLGRHYWERRYEKGVLVALQYFERAVELDPEYALPHTGVADSYSVLGLFGYLHPEEARRRAMSAARRALELDESLSEAHASIGNYEMWLGWDWERGATEFQVAIELKPDNVMAHTWLASLRVCQGRIEEGVEEVEIARRIDPISNYVDTLSATVYAQAGDLDRAVELLEGVLARDPEYLLAVFFLSWGYCWIARYDDAVRLAEQAEALSKGALHFKGFLGALSGLAGQKDRARDILDDLYARQDSEYVSPLFLLWTHLGLGETEQAFELLTKAVAERIPYLHGVHQDPGLFGLLWDHPRFTEVANQVGSGVVSRVWERQGRGAGLPSGANSET
jgi:tetratricopeptide (TPR) repeat protein